MKKYCESISKTDKKNILDECDIIEKDLAHIVRLSLLDQIDDVRLFVARMVRRYRVSNPQLAGFLEEYLRLPQSNRSLMRDGAVDAPMTAPTGDGLALSLLKKIQDNPDETVPLIGKSLTHKLSQFVNEHRNIDKLTKIGLHPSRTAIFVGPPGVGKTLGARWVASQLNIPLFVLDLTTVMSSFLGKTGANLRSVFDFARNTNCVLFLDEIDSIAKKRSDNTDVGELKRLVTIILQEVESWSDISLLLAATNYPDLLDTAVWRRFDAIIEFNLPESEEIVDAIRFFLGRDDYLSEQWVSMLAKCFEGQSYSEIEKNIYMIRRRVALDNISLEEAIQPIIKQKIALFTKVEKIDTAVKLVEEGVSQYTASEVTGVSRDTIRKYKKKDI